jgi:DNA-binding transcriptional LysR family regulator
MRYPDLDLDALRSFVAIAETGGFTAAGELLGRSQAAMSLKIKKLEETLGRRVFERTSRSLSLTRDGEMLLGYARRLLELNDEAVRRFAEPEASGEIRLGVVEYFVPRHLPGVLARFARIHPRVHIDVKVGMSHSLIEALDAGQLDLVIAKRDDGETRGRVIWREDIDWVCAPDFRIDDAAPLPFCAMPPPCVFRTRGFEALKRMGRSWRVVYTSESGMSVLAAARAGLGIMVTSGGTLTPDLRRLGPAEGFPPLGEIEHAVFGEGGAQADIKAALVGFIEDSLQGLAAGRQAA